MKTQKSDYFKVWDQKEKTYLQKEGKDAQFLTLISAIDFKWDYIEAGNYPDDPSDVLEIQAFKDGKFQYTTF